jgi:GNAT superfamily N-acetyltransferase
MTVTIHRVANSLPDGFDALNVDAESDGQRHLSRFAQEFARTPAVFHAIFAGFVDDRLAGIGAITDEPMLPSQPCWRLRRLYVHRVFRRRGVARAIALALLHEAEGRVATVTVNAGSDEAAHFWEAMGLIRSNRAGWSHDMALQQGPP